MNDERPRASAEAETGNAARPLGVLLVVCVALFFGVLNASAVGVMIQLSCPTSTSRSGS